MVDKLNNRARNLGDPGQTPYAITPSDSVDFTLAFDYLYVGGAGDVVVVAMDGSTCTFKAVPAGQYVWSKGKRVNATNTTATNMVGIC